MGLDRLKSVIALVADSTITELSYAEGDTQISLVRQLVAGRSASPPSARVAPAAPAVPSEAGEPVSNAGSPAVPVVDTGTDRDTVVRSPMASVFHRSPTPGADPFIQVGQHCVAGDTVCILEAMKVFSMLEAECAGTLAEFFVNDGEEVEVDQPLYRISRD